ncbi:MAG: xanthine dehydrogenase family protein molybdopterin-binding subunit, partial [Candidatus Geothermarchaeales archaeon]
MRKKFGRKEDIRFITGRGEYLDDIKLEGMLHMAILRSPYSHARILGIDPSEAQALNGVTEVFIASDLDELCRPLKVTSEVPELQAPPVWPLARNRVRFVGDPVAAVVGENPYTVADALELVDVNYEPLTPVMDPEKALDRGAPSLYKGGNKAFRYRTSGGDVEKAFREAAVVVEERFVNQRMAPAPLESRGVVASWSPEGFLSLWSSTQIPHGVRRILAEHLDMNKDRIRVVAPDVGGGFGQKLNSYREEILVAAVSKLLQRPVKWVEERMENLAAATQGRDQIHYVEVAASTDGRILGLRDRIVADVGAYHWRYSSLTNTI